MLLYPWLRLACLVAEGGIGRYVVKRDKFRRIGSVRAEERIETRLFWVRILYFRYTSRPSPYVQDNDPLHALSILDNHLLVSGDVLRRLVFFSFSLCEY